MARRLSIGLVVPVYNRRNLVCDALESIARQSRRPDQVVVVDDGSTDGSSDVIRDWAVRSGLAIQLVQQRNGGIAAARNAGFHRLNTDLVGGLDSDDLYDPGCLDLLARPLENDSAIIGCYAGYRKSIIGKAEVSDAILMRSQKCLPLERNGPYNTVVPGALYRALLNGNFIHVGASLVRRESSASIGWMNESLPVSEDLDYFLRLSRVGKFAYIPEMVLTVRVHRANTTGSGSWKIPFARQGVLSGMLSDRDRLRLTIEEEALTLTARNALSAVILYQASCAGPAEYLRAARALIRTGARLPRVEMLKSAIRSVYVDLLGRS